MNIKNGCGECSCYHCELVCENKCCVISDDDHKVEKIPCLRNTSETLTPERYEELEKLGYVDSWGSCSMCSNKKYRPW